MIDMMNALDKYQQYSQYDAAERKFGRLFLIEHISGLTWHVSGLTCIEHETCSVAAVLEKKLHIHCILSSLIVVEMHVNIEQFCAYVMRMVNDLEYSALCSVIQALGQNPISYVEYMEIKGDKEEDSLS